MVKKVKLFRQKERKSRAEVGEFLQDLGEKVAEGKVILRQTPDDLVVMLPENLRLKVRASKKEKRVKGTQHKLTINLSWTEGDDQDDPLSLG